MSRVLVACEYSGRVRDAFIAAGHDAVSVDLLPTEVPGPHVVGDALDVLEHDTWDLLVAHPPCTYLANSGVRWLYGGKGHIRDERRWGLMDEAAVFFSRLLSAPVPHVAVENPIMHRYGRSRILDYTRSLMGGAPVEVGVSTVQPWQHGHGETKATQLWLRNLPPLEPTDIVDGREQRVWRLGPSEDRWKERSRTFTGIAAAMAAQWGPLL